MINNQFIKKIQFSNSAISESASAASASSLSWLLLMKSIVNIGIFCNSFSVTRVVLVEPDYSFQIDFNTTKNIVIRLIEFHLADHEMFLGAGNPTLHQELCPRRLYFPDYRRDR